MEAEGQEIQGQMVAEGERRHGLAAILELYFEKKHLNFDNLQETQIEIPLTIVNERYIKDHDEQSFTFKSENTLQQLQKYFGKVVIVQRLTLLPQLSPNSHQMTLDMSCSTNVDNEDINLNIQFYNQKSTNKLSEDQVKVLNYLKKKVVRDAVTQKQLNFKKKIQAKLNVSNMKKNMINHLNSLEENQNKSENLAAQQQQKDLPIPDPKTQNKNLQDLQTAYQKQYAPKKLDEKQQKKIARLKKFVRKNDLFCYLLETKDKHPDIEKQFSNFHEFLIPEKKRCYSRDVVQFVMNLYK